MPIARTASRSPGPRAYTSTYPLRRTQLLSFALCDLVVLDAKLLWKRIRALGYEVTDSYFSRLRERRSPFAGPPLRGLGI
jgi:hypothetical protein